MAEKFDANRAWTKAMGMIAANRKVVAIIAGVFFFLPNFALSLLAPDLVDPTASSPPAETPEEAMAQLSSFGPEFFVTLIVLALIQAVGVLGLLRLLTDSGRPTVSEALKSGLSGLFTYVIAQIVQTFIFIVAIGLPLGLFAATGNAAAISAGVVFALVIGIYIFVRLSLLSPAIAIDRIHSPIGALGRSWSLTKGHAGRLTLFFALLFVAIIIALTVLTLVLGLGFAAVGGQVQLIGTAFLSSFANTIVVAIFLAVLAAVHRQLASPPQP